MNGWNVGEGMWEVGEKEQGGGREESERIKANGEN